MNLLKVVTSIFVLGLCSCTYVDSERNKALLPNKYPVFTHENTVINHPYPGFERKILPVNNDYTGNPGCYLACYSHNPQAVYSVTSTIFVEGMVRVEGSYNGTNCEPSSFKGIDISASQKYKDLCNAKLPSCRTTQNATGEGCWAGGDTGEFVGAR